MTTMTVTVPSGFNTALDAFVKGISDRLAASYGDSLPHATFSIDKGRKYLKIVKNDRGGSRSVFCFVRISDGAVLKAEGWKKPAKHVRGSIYVNAGADAVTLYGANYIK